MTDIVHYWNEDSFEPCGPDGRPKKSDEELGQMYAILDRFGGNTALGWLMVEEWDSAGRPWPFQYTEIIPS